MSMVQICKCKCKYICMDDDVICVTLSLFIIAPSAFVVFIVDLCMGMCVVYLSVPVFACICVFVCANVRCVSKRIVPGAYR